MIKRLLDLFFSLIGIIALIPLFIVIGILVRMNGGPIFFQQKRVGLKGTLFRVYKFRSMVVNAEKLGAMVTQEFDPRITTIGRFIRKTKLDELPQLFNVLKGEMSLVGPRPEVPLYVDRWPEKDREIILSVKPGITDYATLYYVDEQAVLANSKDPEKVYVEEILPYKLKLYKNYVRDHNLWLDLKIILSTLSKMIVKKPYFSPFKKIQ